MPVLYAHIVCIGCGATQEVAPTRTFVPIGKFEVCNSCIDKARAAAAEKAKAQRTPATSESKSNDPRTSGVY